METAAGSRGILVDAAELRFTRISAFSSLAVSKAPSAGWAEGSKSCCATTFATAVLTFGAMLLSLRNLGQIASDSITTYHKAAHGTLLYHASVLY